MRTITAAQPIRYDERTDCRELWGLPLGQLGCQELTAIMNHEEEVRFLWDGLMGWGEYTHTLYLDDGCCYHVRIEEQSATTAVETAWLAPGEER
jgi:hypothetical protein